MIATIENIKVDLSKPIDISIPLTNTDETNCLVHIENQWLNRWNLMNGERYLRYVLYNFNNIYSIHSQDGHTQCLGILPMIF
jgi:hypothetical protein